MDERETIPYDEAVKLLPDGDEIHTFRTSGAGMLFGADWPRETLLEAMRKAEEIELTGPAAQALRHGLAIMESGSPLFIETRPESAASAADT